MTTLRMIPGITYTRQNLEALTGMPDRENRRMIREQRRQGVPIVAMKDGGYKMAETERAWLDCAASCWTVTATHLRTTARSGSSY